METVQTIRAIKCVVVVFRNRPCSLYTAGVEDGHLKRQVANVTGLIQVRTRRTRIERVVRRSQKVSVSTSDQRTGTAGTKVVFVNVGLIRVLIVSKCLLRDFISL